MKRILLLALLAAPVGCSWTKKPVTQDPLVLKNRAVPGMTGMPVLCAADHPCPPGPPVDESK